MTNYFSKDSSRFSSDKNKLSVTIEDVFFALLIALISSVLTYQFAVGNQLEQLPIILREIDASYLSGDLFLATTAEFGPRVYFVRFIALLSNVLPIHWIYALLTVISDMALVLVTLWASRTVLNADKLASMIAAVWVLGLTAIHLGDATQIRYEVFQPASLAIPGALFALTFGFKGRPISAAVVASIASLPHPLYGAEAGGIAIGVAFFALLLGVKGDNQKIHSLKGLLNIQLVWRDALFYSSIGATVLGVSLTLFWLLPYGEVVKSSSLNDVDFFNILTRFRAPHHYLPSYFRANDYISIIFFILTSGLAFSSWAKSTSTLRANIVVLPFLLVLALCFLGFIFSEVWPSRAVLTLQLFRLLFIVKWLGFILIAIFLSKQWRENSNLFSKILIAMCLLSGGATYPLIAFVTLSLLITKPWNSGLLSQSIWVSITAVLTVTLWFRYSPFGEFIYLVIALTAVLIWHCNFRHRQIVVFSMVGLLLVLLSLNRGPNIKVNISALVPLFSFDDHQDEKSVVARMVAENTVTTALVLVPPDFGILRLIGKRAIVVDFKSLPFQDHAMLQWRKNIRDVYGDVEGGGFEAEANLISAYKNINDEKLKYLARQFGSSHALLYADTKTTLPLLFQHGEYKLVSLKQ